jgi:hypothetical protein
MIYAATHALLAQLVQKGGLAGPAHADYGSGLAGKTEGAVHPSRRHCR